MPNSMTHLILAKKLRPEGSPMFFIGNLAPDGVKKWEDKDMTHFRNLSDRYPALEALSAVTPESDDFAAGVLLHLYFDWKWDLKMTAAFREEHGNDWFLLYRDEIMKAGAHAFHTLPWAAALWAEMAEIPVDCYGNAPGATREDVKAFIGRNAVWHQKNITEPSEVFPPDLIDRFANEVAEEYKAWRKLK